MPNLLPLVGLLLAPLAHADDPPELLQLSSRQLEVVREFPPPYPMVPTAGEVQCEVAVEIDTEGAPSSVKPGDCPDAFAHEATLSLREWRWTPHEVDGEAVPVGTTITVLFKQGEGGLKAAIPVRGIDGGPAPASVRYAMRALIPYPGSERKEGPATVACTVDLRIAASGSPKDIAVTDCPEPFLSKTAQGVSRWRWESPTVDEERVEVEATIEVRLINPKG